MGSFPVLSPELVTSRLALPKGKKVRMVLDTDAKNEIDDQFAITFALLSEKLQVEALYAAQFSHDPGPCPAEGMRLSYQEILTIQDKLGLPNRVPVFEGVSGPLEELDRPPGCGAAEDLIQRALDGRGEALYVVAIGALSNIAAAILLEPDIITKIVLVWLGGNAYDWQKVSEYNLMGDLKAVQVVLDSGVPLVRFPCHDVASRMVLNREELDAHIRPYGAIGAYLGEIFDPYPAVLQRGESIIWDLAPVAFMEEPLWAETVLLERPRLLDDISWSRENEGRSLHRVAKAVNRKAMFDSLYDKLRNHAAV